MADSLAIKLLERKSSPAELREKNRKQAAAGLAIKPVDAVVKPTKVKKGK
jgi:hypothetical protein